MLLFVVAAYLLSLASSCCIPPQWEGNMGITSGSVVNGTASATEGSLRISYDADDKIVASRLSLVSNGIPVNMIIIEDYNEGITNTIQEDGSCKRTFSGNFTTNCIPEDTAQGIVNYGLGDDTVEAQGYHMTYDGAEVYLVVTADTCVPLAEDLISYVDGVFQMQVMTFSNIKAGIADRSVFSVPESCKIAPILPRTPGSWLKRSMTVHV